MSMNIISTLAIPCHAKIENFFFSLSAYKLMLKSNISSGNKALNNFIVVYLFPSSFFCLLASNSPPTPYIEMSVLYRNSIFLIKD